MANKRNGTIYLGVTSDLVKRAHDHRHGLIEGFTKQHRCKMLIWFEQFDDIQDARARVSDEKVEASLETEGH
jgi:putative endonuclease